MGDGLSAYAEALDYLFVRTTGQWKFGLERTVELLDALGNPHRSLRVIHVGGTNGKGSVCALLEHALRARRFRVAKYTSPHLIDFRERIVVDGEPVAEEAIVEFIERWIPTIKKVGATFFEATTAMSFDLMARAKPDIAIVEVGLGGRLDATNVLDPMLAVVTNVGVDHTEYLGATRELIAAEKAGIFKPERTAIIGERDPRIRDLLARHARGNHASPVVCVFGDGIDVRDVHVTAAGTSFQIGRGVSAMNGRNTANADGLYHTSLVGKHQAQNAAVALTALDHLPPPFATNRMTAVSSFASIRLAGRFDRDRPFVFDVAHNRDGAAALADAVDQVELPRPRVALLSVLRDKDWQGIMRELARVVDRFVLTTAPTSPSERAWDPQAALEFARAEGWDAQVVLPFADALTTAESLGGGVLVTGSFHTVGDAMARLQVSPLAR